MTHLSLPKNRRLILVSIAIVNSREGESRKRGTWDLQRKSQLTIQFCLQSGSPCSWKCAPPCFPEISVRVTDFYTYWPTLPKQNSQNQSCLPPCSTLFSQVFLSGKRIFTSCVVRIKPPLLKYRQKNNQIMKMGETKDIVLVQKTGKQPLLSGDGQNSFYLSRTHFPCLVQKGFHNLIVQCILLSLSFCHL